MVKQSSQVEHTLGREEATSRVVAFASFFEKHSDMEGSWEGSAFRFSVSVQGVRIHSTIHVEEDRLRVESEAPFYAHIFADWPVHMARLILQEQASADPPEEAPSEPPADPAVLFLHMPKAGGISLTTYITAQCGAGNHAASGGLFRGGILYLKHGFFKADDLAVPSYLHSLLARPDLRAVVGHMTFGLHEHLTRPWTYVTLLRDPVDRVLSMYYFLKLQEQMSLEEFVEDPPFREIDNDQTRRIAGVDPALGALTRDALETAKENLRRHFSVIGTIERYEETLVLLNRRLGWTREVPTKRRNATRERKSAAELPASVVDAIRGWNEMDYELHRFADEWMDRAIAEEGPGFVDDMARRRELAAVAQG